MNHEQNCHVDPLQKPLDRQALETAQAAILGVAGMGCQTCAMRVRNGLLQLDGVLVAQVLLEHGVAAVAFDDRRVAVDDLLSAVGAAGNDGRHHYVAQVINTMPATEAFTFGS
jgi:copper chaperone CopZ